MHFQTHTWCLKDSTWIFRCLNAFTQSLTYVLSHTYVHTYIHTYTRTNTETHTSTHTCKHTSARAVHLLYAQEEEEDDPYQLPISHEVTLGSGHNKAVTCLDIDHSGSRLLTGKVMYRVSMCTRACV